MVDIKMIELYKRDIVEASRNIDKLMTKSKKDFKIKDKVIVLPHGNKTQTPILHGVIEGKVGSTPTYIIYQYGELIGYYDANLIIFDEPKTNNEVYTETGKLRNAYNCLLPENLQNIIN